MLTVPDIVDVFPAVLAFSLVASLLYMIISSYIGDADIYTLIAWSVVLIGWLLLMANHWAKKVPDWSYSTEQQMALYVVVAAIVVVSAYLFALAKQT